MGISEAILIFANSNPNIIKEAREKLRKAKDAAHDPQDYGYHHTDENVLDGNDHFPIYDISTAKKTVAQLKGLIDIPNWWDGDEIERFRQHGINKIKSRWGNKIDISKIQSKTVKKKPTTKNT
jgi:hypothetical protein